MKLINILLVEDDQLDVMDIRRSLDKLSIQYQLHTARNGEEAVDFLIGRSIDGPMPLPDFVLIDINMPKMNGLELLETIRKSEVWRHLKCFIVTTTDEKIDRERAEALQVSGYIIKPLKLSSPSSMQAFNLMIDLLNH
jgi:CheY-like chemotaxis protein